MARIDCPGEVSTDVDGVALCHAVGDPLTALAWVEVPDFSLEDIDPEVATEYFAAGFVVIGIAWAIGYGVRLLLEVIRK